MWRNVARPFRAEADCENAPEKERYWVFMVANIWGISFIGFLVACGDRSLVNLNDFNLMRRFQG